MARRVWMAKKCVLPSKYRVFFWYEKKAFLIVCYVHNIFLSQAKTQNESRLEQAAGGNKPRGQVRAECDVQQNFLVLRPRRALYCARNILGAKSISPNTHILRFLKLQGQISWTYWKSSLEIMYGSSPSYVQSCTIRPIRGWSSWV